jgi:hypothetical protein
VDTLLSNSKANLSSGAGREELFQSGWFSQLASLPHAILTRPGILHSYMYSQLYNPNSKIIVRTTVRIQGFDCSRDLRADSLRHKIGCSSLQKTLWPASLVSSGKCHSHSTVLDVCNRPHAFGRTAHFFRSEHPMEYEKFSVPSSSYGSPGDLVFWTSPGSRSN